MSKFIQPRSRSWLAVEQAAVSAVDQVVDEAVDQAVISAVIHAVDEG